MRQVAGRRSLCGYPGTRGRLRLSLRWRVAAAFGLGSLVSTTVMALASQYLASGYMLHQREEGVLRQGDREGRESAPPDPSGA